MASHCSCPLELQFYNAYCNSRIGKLYEKYTREHFHCPEFYMVFNPDEFANQEQRLVVNLCAANSFPEGLEKILYSVKTYVPEDAQILFAMLKVRVIFKLFIETCVILVD